MKIIHKSAWIHIKDRKMLFLRPKGKDIFYLPGGKTEERETSEQALVREMKEEASIDLFPGTISQVMQFKLPAHGRENTEVEIRAYYADFSGEIIAANEIETVGWFDSREEKSVPSAGRVILKWLKEQDLID